MSKTYFEQYVEYRLMDFKFSTIGNDSNGMNHLLEKHLFTDENPHVKQVCAKLPIPLVDEIDSIIQKLNISKRKFIELALIEAIEKVSRLEDKVDIFEFLEAEDERRHKEQVDVKPSDEGKI